MRAACGVAAAPATLASGGLGWWCAPTPVARTCVPPACAQVDEIPLSRPKRNIARDFSDGGEEATVEGAHASARKRQRGPTGQPPLLQHALPVLHARPARGRARGWRTRAHTARPAALQPRAVLLAEIVAHYFPKLVELHNYRWGKLHTDAGARMHAAMPRHPAHPARPPCPPCSAANSTNQKMYNWNTMNQKVFKRLGFTVSKQDFEAISNCQVGACATRSHRTQPAHAGITHVMHLSERAPGCSLPAQCSSHAHACTLCHTTPAARGD